MPPISQNRKNLILLIASCALALGLGLYKISVPSLFLNEHHMLLASSFSLKELLRHFIGFPITPELYEWHQPIFHYLMSWAWRHLSGLEVGRLRALSVVGLLGILWISRKLAALLFQGETSVEKKLPWLLATSPFLIWWGQTYYYPVWLGFFNLLSLYFYLRLLLSDTPKKKHGFGFILFSALGLYTHYFSAVLFGFQIIFVFLGIPLLLKRKPAVFLWTKFFFFILLLITPLFLVLSAAIPHYAADGRYLNASTPISLLSLAERFFQELFMGPFLIRALNHPWIKHIPVFFLSLLIAFLILRSLKKFSKHPFAFTFILSCSFWNLGIILLTRMSLFTFSYTVYLLPFLWMLLLLGSETFRSKKTRNGIFAALLLLHAISLCSYYKDLDKKYENTKDPAAYILTHPLPHHPPVLTSGLSAFPYYYPGEKITWVFLKKHKQAFLKQWPEFYFLSYGPGEEILRLVENSEVGSNFWKLELIKQYPCVQYGRDTYLYRLSPKTTLGALTPNKSK